MCSSTDVMWSYRMKQDSCVIQQIQLTKQMFDLPFDTCCTFLVFGLPLSKRYKKQILIYLHKI